jgi:hypothetical protein
MFDSYLGLSPLIWKGIFSFLNVFIVGLLLALFATKYQKRKEEAIRKFYNHPTLSHRSDPDYSYEFFSAEDGYLMQRLVNTIAGKEENKPKVMKLITMYAAMGVIEG